MSKRKPVTRDPAWAKRRDRTGRAARPPNFRPDSAYRPVHGDGLDSSDSSELWTMTDDDEREAKLHDNPGPLRFPGNPRQEDADNGQQ